MGLKSVGVAGITTLERVVRGARIGRGPGSVESVLVLEQRVPLGCCVHLTPAIEALKRSRPGVTLTVATRGVGAKLLRHHPDVDHLIVTPDGLTDTRGTARFLREALKARGIRPDCTLTGGSDQQTRIGVLAFLAGAGWRGGFTLIPGLFARPLAYDKGRSLIDNNVELAGLIGGANGHREPSVYFSAADVQIAEALVQEARAVERPLITFVTQGSGGQNTGWHTERWAEVLRYADGVLGCAVAFVGTSGHAEAIAEIRSAAGGVGLSLTGRTTVTELAAFVAMSDAVVTVDTGSMHVSRAVGVPMVVLAPSWQKAIEWIPLDLEQVRVLRGEDRVGVPPGYKLDEIAARDVMEALGDLMGAYPASAGRRAERVAARLSAVDHAVV